MLSGPLSGTAWSTLSGGFSGTLSGTLSVVVSGSFSGFVSSTSGNLWDPLARFSWQELLGFPPAAVRM
jgi:hypothetical protein